MFCRACRQVFMKRMTRGHDGSVKFPTVAAPTIRRAGDVHEVHAYRHNTPGYSKPVSLGSSPCHTVCACTSTDTMHVFNYSLSCSGQGSRSHHGKGQGDKSPKACKGCQQGYKQAARHPLRGQEVKPLTKRFQGLKPGLSEQARAPRPGATGALAETSFSAMLCPRTGRSSRAGGRPVPRVTQGA